MPGSSFHGFDPFGISPIIPKVEFLLFFCMLFFVAETALAAMGDFLSNESFYVHSTFIFFPFNCCMRSKIPRKKDNCIWVKEREAKSGRSLVLPQSLRPEDSCQGDSFLFLAQEWDKGFMHPIKTVIPWESAFALWG